MNKYKETKEKIFEKKVFDTIRNQSCDQRISVLIVNVFHLKDNVAKYGCV